jgi:hypothetical protein
MRCNPKYTRQELIADSVDSLPTSEDQVICLLKQIRFLLFKLSESIAPSIFTSYLVEVGSDKFEDIYKSGSNDRIVEVQNVSSLTDYPNDLIIRPASTKLKGVQNKDVGLILRPSERIRLHVPIGGTITAKFREAPSVVAISELTF